MGHEPATARSPLCRLNLEEERPFGLCYTRSPYGRSLTDAVVPVLKEYFKLIPSPGADFRALRLLCCAALILLASFGARSQVGAPSKNVLVLYDEHSGLPGLTSVDKSIKQTLSEADPSVKTSLYAESMDLSRFQRNGYDEFLRDYYTEKYRDKKIDVVIAVMEPALNFAIAYVEEIAPGAPIVFCGIDPRDIAGRDLRSNVTGVLVQRDFKGSLEVALKLHPETRQVVFVGGTSDFDKYLVSSASQQLKVFENRVNITYLNDLPLSEILHRVQNLPPDTVVLCSTVFRDGAGESFVPHEVVSRISETANVPVYGFVDQYLGRGIVGGHLYSVEAHGRKAAEIALKILGGESAANIPIVEAAINVDMFDARQLRRWNINKSSLPIGSVVLFDEPTIWEAYKWYIIGMTAAIIIEALLIAGLVFLRVRRRQVQEENLRLSSRLGDIVSNVPGIVWETRTDPATKKRKTTFISDYVQRMLGYTPEEWLKQPPGFGFRIVEEEDREKAKRESEEVVETGEEAVSEFRWRTKDGRIRWVENYLSPLIDDNGGVVGLRGVALDVTDRKLAEEAARRTEERNSAIISAIPDLMFVQSPDGVYLDYHTNSEDDLLMPPEQFLGKKMEDVLPPELATRFSDAFKRVWESGEPQVVEYSLMLQGETHWYEARVVRTTDNFLSVVRDITERKVAEDAVQQGERRLLRAQQAARVGTWEWDVATGISVWSEMIWELLGLEPGDGESSIERFLEFIHPDDRERTLRNVNEVLDHGEEFYDEFRVVHRDGTMLWVTSKGVVIRSEDGKAEKMLGVNIDITERKLQEEAIRESEERFRNMADTAPMMVWVAGTDKLCSYVNKRWLDFRGRTMEQELGDGWVEGVHPRDWPHCLEVHNASFERKDQFELEFRLRRFDGVYRWVVSRGTPRFTPQGEFLGYIGTAMDITDRKESERELREAHDELNQLKNQLEAENIYLQEELRQDQAFGDIVGQSSAIKYVLYKISQVAPIDSTVLIMGETGTGKELVARAIHEASRRADRPLIKVNCAALSPSLVESELFGHEKGAFTGAGARKLGRFELANTGTLLLDEIGELPLDLQSKLLRVLQEGEFERVGSGTTITTDVRIIALTNRDLKQEVEKGKFREDLWYRLNVFPITTPPLRDRKDDIPILTEHFARTLARKFGKEVTAVSPDTLKSLSSYSWPGNVRELANVIERAVINLRGTVLRVHEDFSAREAQALTATVKTLEEMERDYIVHVLEDLHWRIDGPRGAARILGINPSTLRTRMIKLGIQKPNGRGA